MYNLLLVDDEPDVRQRLMNGMNWSDQGFNVVDTAENGLEAIERIERYRPELVITDISMPFMNGLELSDWIRVEYPATRIVLLTGYDEFEFAKRAIKLEVDEFILKPFSMEEIVQALVRVKQRIEAEERRFEDVKMLREHYRTSLPVLRETFLASLLSRKMSHSQIVEQARTYEVALDGTGYAVSVINLQHYDEQLKEGNNHGLKSQSSSLQISGDLNLQLFAILNIAGELWSKRKMGRVFLHQDHIVLLSISRTSDQSNSILRHTITLLQELLLQIDRLLKLKVTIGLGDPISRLDELREAYDGAMQAIEYRLLEESNRIIYIGDVEMRAYNRLRFNKMKEQELVRCLKLGAVAKVKEVVYELFNELIEAEVPYRDYKMYIVEILTSVLKAARETDAYLEDIHGALGNVFLEIEAQETLSAARDWLTAICTNLTETVMLNRKQSFGQFVQQAMEYVHTHFADRELSINQVCNYLHISVGYFSSIFKKETTVTFVTYLINIRMEAAKELLSTTDLKAFEIAERVGFADPNYFSFTFKKHIGISPKEYRNRIAKEWSTGT